MLESMKRGSDHGTRQRTAYADLLRWHERSTDVGQPTSYRGTRLSVDQVARVEEIVASDMIISLHDHVLGYPPDRSEFPELIRAGHDRVAIGGAARCSVTAVFDNGRDGSCCSTAAMTTSYQDLISALGLRMTEIARQDFVTKAESLDDLEDALATGRVAHIFCVESSAVIGQELNRLDVLYGIGVRQIGVTCAEANALGSGNRERGDGGLTYFGERAVTRMNELGLAIDISHCGDRTALEVIERSKQPVFITHAGSRSVRPSPVMKPDNVIRACAERDGLIGIAAMPSTPLSAAYSGSVLESLMEHFEFCVDLVGIEHVTFGPNTLFGECGPSDDGGERDPLNHDPQRGRSTREADSTDGRPSGRAESHAEAFPTIVRWLVTHDYSDDEIRAVIGRNTVRALAEIWR
jgi:membrane dipeptidase